MALRYQLVHMIRHGRSHGTRACVQYASLRVIAFLPSKIPQNQ